MITNSFRIFPNKNQISSLIELASIKDEIYNHFLEMQQNEYETNKKIIFLYDAHKILTELKQTQQFSHWKKINAKCAQRILTELDGGYKSFFKLIKKDKSARPPQKREVKEGKYTTITFNQSGWTIDYENNKITINKIEFRYKSHHKIHLLNIKELKIKLLNNKWLCDISVDEKRKYIESKQIKNKVIAFDLGLSKLATGIDSNGKVIVFKNKAKSVSKYYSKIINEIKSKQSKKEKYSNRWQHLQDRKKYFYNKKNKQVKETLHIQSKKLVDMNYNTIIVGDIKIKKLMEIPKNKYSKVSKSFGNSNVSMFIEMLLYKAIKSNINVVKQSEYNTTQMNSLTGKLFENKVKLEDRIVELKPGLLLDRDLNSAINIYKKWETNHLAVMTPPLSNVLDDVFEQNNLFCAKNL